MVTIKNLKLNWMDFLIMKALVSSESKELLSSELRRKLKIYCQSQGLEWVSRIFVHQRLEKLIEWGLVKKVKTVENIYSLNPEHSGYVASLCLGFFGIVENKEGK